MIYFILLTYSLVSAVEYVNSSARSSGILVGSLSAGLMVQNALSIFTRFFMFIMMPVLGYVADTGILAAYNKYQLLTSFWIPIIIIGIFWIFRKNVFNWVNFMVHTVQTEGKIKIIGYKPKSVNIRNRPTKADFILKLYYTLYIPYYLAWPLTIYFMSAFPDYRTTILTTATVFTGVNTVIMTIWTDPKISYLSSKKRTMSLVLYKSLTAKFLALLTSTIIITFVIILSGYK